MAMGTKQVRQKQEDLFYASEQAEAPGHPFYERLNQVLEQAEFDGFCEGQCRKFYHTKLVTAVSGAGRVFPAAADRILRRHRKRARHRLAGGRQLESAQ
jgi:hypothetical protein